MRTVITLTEVTGSPLAWFAIGTFGLSAGLMLGVILSVRGITRGEDRTAKLAKHQAEPADPAVSAWLASLPRPRYPRPGRRLSHQDFIDWGAGEWGAGK